MSALVLILGDGNFSFARSLVKKVDSTSAVLFIVTSFDSFEECIRKYPESEGIISNFDCGLVKVVHSIDATKSLRDQLPSAFLMSASSCTIIFNFPHLGQESAKLHSAMLAHIMYRSHEFLTSFPSPSSSCLALSLANAQAERWRMKEMATRNEMELFDSFPFRSEHWPGYEVKRHQSGKGFEKRVDDCAMFLFIQARVQEAEEVITKIDNSRFIHQNAFLRLLQDASSMSPSIAAVSVNVMDAHGGGKSKIEKNKKRRVEQLTESMWIKGIEETDSSLTLLPYRCLSCSRRFRTEQGIKTHVYNVHIQNPALTDNCPDVSTNPHSAITISAAATTTIFTNNVDNKEEEEEEEEDGANVNICSVCGKESTSVQALRDHHLGAHGKFEIVKPSWAVDPLLPTSGAEECAICGLLFDNSEELHRHLEAGFSPSSSTKLPFPCTICGKEFVDLRAWSQHSNFCVASSSSS